MDGIHDMGGMHGFGKVEPEANEPVFHAKWEGRVFALTRAISYTGAWPIDRSRFAQEKLPPDVYLSVSYYKRWELGLESNLAALGLAGADEIAAGHALRPAKALERKLSSAEVPNSLTRGTFRAAGKRPRPLQARRPRAGKKYSSGDTYAAAALCPRPRRRDRSGARLSRLS